MQRIPTLLMIGLLFVIFGGCRTYQPKLAILAEESKPLKFKAYIGGFLGPSYEVELKNGQLAYFSSESGLPLKEVRTEIHSPAAKWREFRLALDELKVWEWQSDYPNPGVLDGTQWSFEIIYPDRALKSKGCNSYPDTTGQPKNKPQVTESFQQFLSAIQALLGGKGFQ